MPNFFYFHFDGFSTFVTLLERQLILLCFWTQSISIIASKYWPWPWPDYLDIMTIDLTQMFTTFRLLARHTLNFCKLLFDSFNDFFFFAWNLSLIRWHLAYEYSGCGVWALVCGGIWCACTCIGWKNKDSQVSTWLLKNPRFHSWQT